MKRQVFIIVLLLAAACKMYHTPKKVNYTAKGNVKEGERLTMLLCGGCHYDDATKQLTGRRMHDVPGIVGKVYSSNITNTGYTDGELVYLIRTGIAKNGKLMPYMQRPNLATEDLNAIIAYLKQLKPSNITPPATKYTPIGKFGISKFSKPLPYTDTIIAKPKDAGKYLVDNLGCFHCHSAGITKLNLLEPEKSKGYLAGGQKMKDMSGKKIPVPNITFHETGIGNWTEEDLRRALKNGIGKENTVITLPMPQYPELTDEEIKAIYSYLKTVPAIDHTISRRKTTAPYVKYGCQGCHGKNGLAETLKKYNDEQLTVYIDNPRAFGNTKMPAFKGVIKQEDYGPLIAYIKSLTPSSRK